MAIEDPRGGYVRGAEGRPRHQGGRVLGGATTGKPRRRCPAPGVPLPGNPAVAPDVAAAAAAPTHSPPPRAARQAAEAAERTASGELTVLSETVANVDFVAFYDAERRSLVRFVMFLGADASTAEDIAQTTFLRAFAVWNTSRLNRAWLRKVAQNDYFMHCRAAARQTSLDADPERGDRLAGVSAAVAVEQQAVTREVLGDGIAGLPPKQRQVMAWHWDGFSDAEIAAELGDTAAAVRKNRNRAMKNLRQSLAQVWKEGK